LSKPNKEANTVLGSALRFSVAAWCLNLKMKSYPDFAPQVFNVLPQVFNILLKHIVAHCRIELLQNFREKMTEDDSRQKDSLRIFVLCVTICVIFCLSLSLFFCHLFIAFCCCFAVLVLALCFELFEPLLQLLAATVLP
jgi:dolichol kinase